MKSLLRSLLPLFALSSSLLATDVSITSTSVLPSSSAIKRYAVAGVQITAGKLVYKSATDNKLYLADGDSATAAVRDCVGIAVATVASGAECTYVTEDPNLTIGGTVVNGTIYVLSSTAGGIAPAADLTTGWFTTVVGVGTSSSTIAFRAKPLRTSTAL